MHLKLFSIFGITTVLYLFQRYLYRKFFASNILSLDCSFFFFIKSFLGKMEAKNNPSGKSDAEKQEPVVDRDKVKQEREAKRLAKQAAKQKQQDKSRNLPNVPAVEQKTNVKADLPPKTIQPENSQTKEIGSDKNMHRKSQKHGKNDEKPDKSISNPEVIANDLNKLKISSETKPSTDAAHEKPEKKQLTKAERRAIQEAQRAAKASKSTEKSAPQPTKKETTEPKPSTSAASSKQQNTQSKSNVAIARKSVVKKPPQHQHRVKLFNHLYVDTSPADRLSSNVHPAIVRLGVQYSSGVVKGCNARGLAFMSAIKSVIVDYETPSQKEFSRSLEDEIKSIGSYLHKCRFLAVSVTNAMKFIQFKLRLLPKTDSDSDVSRICVTKNILLFR